MTPAARAWAEQVATLFGAIGFVLIAFGVLMMGASYKLWDALEKVEKFIK